MQSACAKQTDQTVQTMDFKVELLKTLSADEYVTASQLSSFFHVSNKTIRSWVKSINDEGEAYGVSIESRPHYGYILICRDPEDVSRLIRSLSSAEVLSPDSPNARLYYLIKVLFESGDYIRIGDVADELFVSRPTMQGAVREAEGILNQYNLTLKRRPAYGIRVEGNEFDIRRCISSTFARRNNLLYRSNMESVMHSLAEMIKDLMNRYDIHLTDVSFASFLFQSYVGLERMKDGHYIELNSGAFSGAAEKEIRFVKELLSVLTETYHFEAPEDEAYYMLIYLMAGRRSGSVSGDETNFVIHEEIDELTTQILETVYQEFHLDLRDNFEIRMLLNQHLVPMDIRLQFDIQSVNPMLDEIKRYDMQSYIVAAHVSAIISEKYRKPVSEDEIGYLAFIFALAKENSKDEKKVNILIVCAAGKASSRLLANRYQREFSRYIDRIYLCDLAELARFDFDKVDYILTTVNVAVYVPKPIMEVGYFFSDNDRAAVQELLEKGESSFLRKYFRPSAFYTDITGDTKEEIIQQMCKRAGYDTELPEGFADAVLKREALAPTDFGNRIALPHPYKTVTDRTIVCTAVLKKPILWSRNEVQVVILASTGRESDPDEEEFYRVTTQLIVGCPKIDELIQNPSYEAFMNLLKEI
ncbi:MAG: PRD domain-containing protein [Erysipelotrichaceae bacterium]|nr:PRD domain-containing protein [Erysipelotrichaceae bacterium]